MATANGERESLCLHVLVKSAQSLLKKDLFGMCDPYVRVILRRDNKIHSSTTKTKRKTRNPEWNEKLQFKDVNQTKDFLILEVYDEHRLTRDNFLGRVIIKLSEFRIEAKVEDIYTYGQVHTFQLKQRSHKSRVSGSIKLKLLYYNSTRLRGASRGGGGPVVVGGPAARPTNGSAERQMSIASLVPGASGGLTASPTSQNGLRRPNSVLSIASAEWTTVDEDVEEVELPLPEGWEQRMDANGRVFYVDHANRRTQWNRPTTPSSDMTAQVQLERRRQFQQTMRRRIPTTEPSISNSPSLSTPQLSRADSSSPNSSPNLDRPSLPRQTSATPTTIASPSPATPQRPLSAMEQPSPSAADNDLPPGWEARKATSGKTFYVDHNTRTTHWVHPRRRTASVTPTSNSSPSSSPSTPPQQAEQPQQGGGEASMGPLPPGWEMRKSGDGRVFFIDHNTHSTQWEDPRAIKQHQQKKAAMPYSRDYKRKYDSFQKSLQAKKPENLPRQVDIPLRRDHVFEDSYRVVMSMKNKDLFKTRLYVKFAGETGLDYGGLSREWFFLLSHEMLNPYYGLFEYAASDNYTLQVNPNSGFCNERHLEYFRFIGRIFAMAIYHKRLIDAFFIRPFYKMVVGRPITLADMEAVDTEFYNSIKYILENDPEPLCLNFLASREFLGQVEEVELKPNGADIDVTEENKKEYIKLMMRWRFEDRICKQMEAIKKGFNDIFPLSMMKMFDEREIEYLMCGLADINVEDWKRYSIYANGYTAEDQTVVWFWKAVENMDSEMRARLLQFVTGTSKVPMNGFAELQGSNGPQKFCIKKLGGPDSLPRSHTCFNRIDLPPYRSYHELKEKLKLAIENTEGFEGVD